MKSFSGVGKALGVALCLAGVVMTALYRGPRIHPLNLHFPSGHHRMSHLDEEPAVSKTTWIKGTLFVITATMTWSLWLVLQVISLHNPPSPSPWCYLTIHHFAQGILMREYPSKLLFTTLECLFATLQSIFVAMAFERDTSKWKLQLDVGLLAILYCVSVDEYWMNEYCCQPKWCCFCCHPLHSSKRERQYESYVECMAGVCGDRSCFLHTNLVHREEGSCLPGSFHTFISCFHHHMFIYFSRRDDFSGKVENT